MRIARNAFGDNVPVRDLCLSADHAVFVDGTLVPVELLMNGTTVIQENRGRMPEHAVVLADGQIRLFPDRVAPLARDVAPLWETRGAAPFVMAGKKLAAGGRS